MSDKAFAIITVLISSVFGVIVAIVTNRLTSSSEERGFRRQLRREKVEATRTLYEDALYVLNRTMRTFGYGDNSEQSEIDRMLARLALLSTVDIRNQYEKAAEAVENWAATYRKSRPEKHGDMMFVKSGMGKYAEEAKLLLPAVDENISKLTNMMLEHIATLMNEL